MRRLLSSSIPAALVGVAALLALGCAQGAAGSGDAGGGGDGGGAIDAASDRIDAEPAVEICDGMDNDGDQFVDEGTDQELCGVVTNGMPRCNGLGGCSVAGCDPGFLDLDNLFNTGCECVLEATENASLICEDGFDLGQFPDTDASLEVVGKLTSPEDVDFYRFTAIDAPDTSCDAFHVRVMFLDNPGDQFQFDLMRGGCAGTGICNAITEADWYTNFATGNPQTGQCPCTDPAAPIDNVPQCTDDGAEFVVKVTRKPGFPTTCDDYKLEVSNGKYPPP